MKSKNGSTLNLLLKNSFRNTIKSLPVVLGLTLLIALLSLVISLMTSIGTRVVNNYHDLDRASNLRQAVISMGNDDLVNDTPLGQNNVENQQYYIYKLEQQYATSKDKNKKDLDFYWSRTEGRNFQGVKNGSNDLKVKIVSKVTTNTSEESVDDLAISKGRDIVYNADNAKQQDNPHDVVLDATFAKKNGIKIGDIIRVQEDDLGNQLLVKSSENTYDKFKKNQAEINKISDLSNPDDVFYKEFSTYNWLQVCGFGESSDYTMPIIDSQTPMPNKSTELIAYVNPHVMGLYKDTQPQNNQTGFYTLDVTRSVLQVMSASDEEAYYSIKFKNSKITPTKAEMAQMNADLLATIGKQSSDKQYVFLDGDSDYQYASRTSAIRTTMRMYETIAGVIFAVVAIVVIFCVVLISKKQIDKTRSQIGVMKALGYQKRKIVWNYVTMPFISALAGGILGFVLAQVVQNPLISLFNEYFNLDISGWSFDIPGFMIDVVVMWFVITAIGFGIAYWVMNVDTLELLSAAKASHISKFGMKIKDLNKSPKITPKMESALLASNSGKMFSVTLIVLLATIVMTASFTLPTVLNQNKTKSYTGVKYKQVVEYNDPIYNNPYTFMKTWDPEIKGQNYKYSSKMNKLTSNLLAGDGDYDYSAIFKQLETGKISSEYYDLEFGANSDKANGTENLPAEYTDAAGHTWEKHGDEESGFTYTRKDNPSIVNRIDPSEYANEPAGIPNALQGLTANMKMLQMYNVVLSNKYFKAISDWAIKDSFGWNILSNQWPSYMAFTQNLRDIANGTGIYKSLKTTTDKLKASYLQLQNFYKTYIESVGLTITRDYYNYNSNDEAKTAYLGHDYATQIDLFNASSNSTNKATAFKSFKDENDAQNNKAFGSILNGLDNQVVSDFKISDGKNSSVAINHIASGPNAKAGNKLDHYLTDSPDKMSDDELKQRICDYLTWYGAFFSQRSGTAIVQAGYSRPPYFVQQYMKKAYNANNDKDIYRFGFSSTPFNPDKDQLGTEINATTKNGKRDVNFKIYGIQNNTKFIDLKDSEGHDLINRLFDKNYDVTADDDTPAIVVNKSLATKLNLKNGQEVNWDVLYKELQSEGTAYNTTQWSQNNPRQATKATGWISMNDMDTFDITIDGIKFSAGSTNLTNAPSDFYKKYLDGTINNASLSKPQSFKIVGIQNSYGDPAAWIKNSDAENVLRYNQARDWLWANLFAQQFAESFKYVAPESRTAAQKTLAANGYMLSDEGTQRLYDGPNGTGKTLVDYDTFEAKMTEPNWLSKADLKVAEKIMDIFNGAYPIYNYKYSLSDDIGDLQAAVSTWDETGGYSPIEENGGYYNGKAVNAIGKGALSSLQPVEISKQILNQLSSVIMTVVIIIIALVIVLAFIIIMLTTSLIISDNIRFISTMKVLGYKTAQIVNTVLGMYAIAIVCAYVIGFICGWFILSGAVRGMAMASSFVLPLMFPWWLIFAVALAVCGIYIITFAIGFYKIQKANPLDALKDMEI